MLAIVLALLVADDCRAPPTFNSWARRHNEPGRSRYDGSPDFVTAVCVTYKHCFQPPGAVELPVHYRKHAGACYYGESCRSYLQDFDTEDPERDVFGTRTDEHLKESKEKGASGTNCKRRLIYAYPWDVPKFADYWEHEVVHSCVNDFNFVTKEWRLNPWPEFQTETNCKMSVLNCEKKLVEDAGGVCGKPGSTSLNMVPGGLRQASDLFGSGAGELAQADAVDLTIGWLKRFAARVGHCVVPTQCQSECDQAEVAVRLGQRIQTARVRYQHTMYRSRFEEVCAPHGGFIWSVNNEKRLQAQLLMVSGLRTMKEAGGGFFGGSSNLRRRWQWEDVASGAIDVPSELRVTMNGMDMLKFSRQLKALKDRAQCWDAYLAGQFALIGYQPAWVVQWTANPAQPQALRDEINKKSKEAKREKKKRKLKEASETVDDM